MTRDRVGRWADKLSRGERVRQAPNHHEGMSRLKSMIGDPRPEGMTLSLISPDSPSSYWGYRHKDRNGELRPARLSTDPADYIWEDVHTNKARRTSEIIQMYKAGVLSEDGEPIAEEGWEWHP